MSKPALHFPDGFTWGAAAASYQIEGAATEDGKGLSVWDMFCRQPGRVWEGHTGDIACDHYHRWKEDIAVMKAIGLQAYRLSVSWPRVIPAGTGAVNARGLEFYDRLVDGLLEAGIEPWVTLFHWDFPYELYLRGGWLNRESVDWFTEYAEVIVHKLSDRVSRWMTLNEPQCFLGLGLRDGIHAPGDKLGIKEVLTAAHHTLMAHGSAVQVIRAHAQKPPSIGWAPVGCAFVPATDSPADIAAARTATWSIREKNFWNNTWWADPVFLGHYPEDGLRVYGHDAPTVRPGDMELIRQPMDFYGVNIYSATKVRAGADGAPETVPLRPGHPHTLFLWKVMPDALYWAPRFLHERYHAPIVITENGLSNQDWVSLDGKVHDPQRIDFMERYLSELRRAHRDGVPVQGYFTWSIMDNFEWAEGFKQRFGIVYVDYETGKRTLKDSASWYREVIRTNGANVNPQGAPVNP
jgi:beta-glucosidase